MSATTITDVVGDRRGLHEETSLVRLLAALDISLILFTLLGVAFFIGFAALEEQLFLLGLPHLLLAPLAGYAALRLGIFTPLALALAGIVFAIDIGQWLGRAIGFPFTLVGFVYLVIVSAFLALDVLLFLALYRLWTVDREENSELNDVDQMQKRKSVLEQEGNTIRVAALFGAFIVLLALFLTLVFLGFRVRQTELLLFSIGHLPLAAYALTLGTRNVGFAVLVNGLGAVQLILDLLQLAFRLLDVNENGLVLLTLASVLAVAFLLINIGIVLVDVMYVLASSGYIYERVWGSDNAKVTISFAKPVVIEEEENGEMRIYNLRQRKQQQKK